MMRGGTAVAAATVVVLAGCGGSGKRSAPPPPRLPSQLASQLASRSDAVAERLAANDGCGALDAAKQLQQEAIAAVNARRVPPRFQEPLLGAANDLVLRIHCAPPPPAPPAEDNQDEHGKGKDKGDSKHGKGKHGGGND